MKIIKRISTRSKLAMSVLCNQLENANRTVTYISDYHFNGDAHLTAKQTSCKRANKYRFPKHSAFLSGELSPYPNFYNQFQIDKKL